VQLLPMTAGSIVLAYNIEGVDDLKLSRDAYVVGDQINYPGRAQINCLVRSQRGARRSLIM
jgi:hypothetical protein